MNWPGLPRSRPGTRRRHVGIPQTQAASETACAAHHWGDSVESCATVQRFQAPLVALGDVVRLDAEAGEPRLKHAIALSAEKTAAMNASAIHRRRAAHARHSVDAAIASTS